MGDEFLCFKPLLVFSYVINSIQINLSDETLFALNGIIFPKHRETGNFKKPYFGWIPLCTLIKILVTIIVSTTLRMILAPDLARSKLELVLLRPRI